MEIAAAVEDLVGLSSHGGVPFEPARVRDYLERMVGLIEADPETRAECDDPVHLVVYHAYRYEPHYAHLADFCAGRLTTALTPEGLDEYLRTWDEAHPR
jgi:hypothetical protein